MSGPGPAIQQYGEWDEEIEDSVQVQRVQTYIQCPVLQVSWGARAWGTHEVGHVLDMSEVHGRADLHLDTGARVAPIEGARERERERRDI